MLVPNCQHVLVCFLVVVFLFLPHHIAPISVVYLLCCPTSSSETLSLSPSCPAPPWKWCHSSHEKGDNGHNGPPSPRCLGAKLCGEKCEASCARIYTHACKIGFLAPSWKRWHGNTLLLAGLPFLPHKEAQTFHKSLQEVKYARLLGRRGKRRPHVLSI